jgi:hypothetical protein
MKLGRVWGALQDYCHQRSGRTREAEDQHCQNQFGI